MGTFFIASSSSSSNDSSSINLNDDLARETFFYETAKNALLTMSKICTFPPETQIENSAVMLKSKEHMKRLQTKAEAINADRFARIEARKQRMLKKISGQVQKETIKNRIQTKKQKSQLIHHNNDEDEFDIELNEDEDRNSAKNQKGKNVFKKRPISSKRKGTQKQNRPGKARRIQMKNRPRK